MINKNKSMIIRLLCLLFILGICLSETSGQNNIYKVFVKSEWQPYFDSLYINYGMNKKFVKDYELQSLIALSYYPELKNVPITFRYCDIKTTMEVRPEYFSALKSSNRKYIISIGTNTHKQSVLLNETSFNAQIGVIGHELAHIMDFEQRSVKSLLILAFKYTVLGDWAKYERSIDRLAIIRGFGWQEVEFANFVQNKSNASVKYKKFKKANYLSAVEIENEIVNMNMYSSFKSLDKSNNPISEKL